MNGFVTSTMQGILFKRRDLFKNSWRPRFFIVDGGTLKYFILKNEYEYYTNARDESERNFKQLVGNLIGPFEESNNSQSSDASSAPFCVLNHVSAQDISINTIYDQQPRGSFKLAGATILIEDEIPQMKLFPFSINLKNADESSDIQTSSSTSTNTPLYKIYLAATTNQDREKWILEISKQCHVKMAPSQSKIEIESPVSITSDPHVSGAPAKKYKRLNPYDDNGSFCIPQPFYLPSMLDDDIRKRYLGQDSILYLIPLLGWFIMRYYNLEGKEFAFIILYILTQRFIFMRFLGIPLPTPNYLGPVSFNFTVDLTGVLRYISTNHHVATADTSSVSLTSIVIKAVADSLRSVPEVNSHHIYLPLLGIDEWYPKNKVSVSFLSTNSNTDDDNDILTIDDVEKMTIPAIASKIDSLRAVSELAKNKKKGKWTRLPSFGVFSKQDHEAALVIICPDTENSKLEMTVNHQSTNTTVAIGSIRVTKRENKKVYSLSVSIIINCVKCSVGMCRRFALQVQKNIQEPESI